MNTWSVVNTDRSASLPDNDDDDHYHYYFLVVLDSHKDIVGVLLQDKRATSILHHMHSFYSGVRQPSFHRALASYLREDQERLQQKTRYEDYLP